MKINCMFHPTRTGHWTCEKCGNAFCPDCVIKREKGGYQKNDFIHLCPKCHVPAKWVGVSGIIDPFWKRLPKIFLYPFSLQPLILMTVLTVATMLFAGPGLVKSLIRFAIWGVMLKYSFSALKSTAAGNLFPPRITMETISDDFDQVFKQLAIYIVVSFACFYVFAKLGAFAGFAVLIFLLVSIPSMIILLVVTEKFAHAINPMLFVPLMLRIGWGYLLMGLFLVMLAGAPAAVMQMIFKMFPPAVAVFISVFAKNFYTLVSYHLMGYVLLQYHQEIGYSVDFDQFKDPDAKSTEEEADDPDLRLLKEVTPVIQEGNLEAAFDAIHQYASGQGISNKILAERYFNLLKTTKRTPEMLEFGIEYLNILVRENDRDALVKVYTLCRSLNSEFTPAPPVLIKLAELASGSGKVETAIRFYNQLIKKYPQDPLTPRAYFRAAQLFHDRLMKPDKSRQIIELLLKRYPESDVAPKAKSYLSEL